MIMMEQNYTIDNWHPEEDFDRIVRAARLCYQAEPLNTQEEKENFLRKLIKNNHLTPFEHSSLSVIFVTDRGVTHELVRHRLAAYCQESTRYCNYSKDKFAVDYDDADYREKNHIVGRTIYDGNIRVIWDSDIKEEDRVQWATDLEKIERMYLKWLKMGYSPQIARTFLPNALKTQIMVTANLREWRHIFELRCSKAAHPHIRELLVPLLRDVQSKIPVVFDDILENVELE